ncbi:hypothetical protein FRB90_001256 [Tulasnella sp. 427]|nr:hypothetical protein FRB90_001256 [Tulasnella sp. 427]
MTDMVTISDLRFLDAAADDDPDDSDYEPAPSDLVSDVSMASSTNSVVSHVTSTDVSIPSAVPSDVLSAADPFEIFPDDSISQRNAKLAAQTRHHVQRPPSEASEAPSIISFHSSALRFHLNSLYASKHLVENALREGQDPAPLILDVGTGSGRWAIDMALQFPHAQVIGLDLVPPAKVGEMIIPPNCRFEVDDANLTFEHYHQFFRLVHVRSADQGINDFESFLYEIARTLLPGGILLLVTGYPQIYDVDKKPFPVVEEGEPKLV